MTSRKAQKLKKREKKARKTTRVQKAARGRKGAFERTLAWYSGENWGEYGSDWGVIGNPPIDFNR